VSDGVARDDEALRLRVQGKSFAAIAGVLGYGRAYEANEAFNRALRRRPLHEQATLRVGELARLEAMADGIHDSRGLSPDEIASRLRAVERLRAMLLGD
jgi:hypothetical protein